ncbi:hypothetical protein HF086_002799 [Spodoptera exigua]|uniref:Uncharacterized protein n=1 Tax=Spodoptera exigua TaxID=7107 RepID=A0A922MNJ9_SPOEX|nr:hypothetical protein HF086_002799 [Spodoptera exigua]
MFPLYIFAVILQVVSSSLTPHCQKDVEVTSIETKNPEDIIGNWKFVYHWDPNEKLVEDYLQVDHDFECPGVKITAADEEFVKKIAGECTKDEIPFAWEDAKVRIDAPYLQMDGALVILGEKETWLIVDCAMMVRIEIKKISDNYIVMTNPEKGNTSEMIARYSPAADELDCVARNLDVVKGMKGFKICK